VVVLGRLELRMGESRRGDFMTYKGVARGRIIELEGEVALPEGTRVSVVPEEPMTVMTLKVWLKEARQLRAQLPKTSDSVDILRQMRDTRASR
jgi:hypothetical protein